MLTKITETFWIDISKIEAMFWDRDDNAYNLKIEGLNKLFVLTANQSEKLIKILEHFLKVDTSCKTT
jgi:lauroyl/myristoyl acyltransferase